MTTPTPHFGPSDLHPDRAELIRELAAVLNRTGADAWVGMPDRQLAAGLFGRLVQYRRERLVEEAERATVADPLVQVDQDCADIDANTRGAA